MSAERFAALVLLGLSPFVSVAQADDWGCQVLLCLSNPQGPMAVSECQPPITRLYSALRRGRAFPTCDFAQGPNGRTWAEVENNPYDPCPPGTQALPQGSHAIQASSVASNSPSVSAGIGTGANMVAGRGDNFSVLPQKVCVTGYVGDTTVTTGQGDDYQSITTGIYQRVALLDPARSPNVINVYIDSVPVRAVRF
jgi:hypothetical protein